MTPLSRLMIVALLIFSIALPPMAAAQQTTAPISITVTQDKVNLSLGLELRENFTALPPLHSSLYSSNSTILSAPMQVAMRKLVPGARIDSLELRAGTSLADAARGTWTLTENYTIVVEGVNQNLQGLVRSNLAFIAMNVSDPIRLGGVEINALGSEYLLTPFKNLPYTSTSSFYFDGAPYSNPNVSGNATEIFRLLDFSWISPVAIWSNTQDPLAGSTVWSLTPRINPFNLTVGLRQIENVLFPVYAAVFVPTLQVTAPARAWAQGTMVLYNLTTPAETIMSLVIIGSIAILFVATVLERRFRFRAVGKKKR